MATWGSGADLPEYRAPPRRWSGPSRALLALLGDAEDARGWVRGNNCSELNGKCFAGSDPQRKPPHAAGVVHDAKGGPRSPGLGPGQTAASLLCSRPSTRSILRWSFFPAEVGQAAVCAAKEGWGDTPCPTSCESGQTARAGRRGAGAGPGRGCVQEVGRGGAAAGPATACPALAAALA